MDFKHKNNMDPGDFDKQIQIDNTIIIMLSRSGIEKYS